MSIQLHAPTVGTPREQAPGTHWIGGWVGPRGSLDIVTEKNSLPLLGIEHQTSGQQSYPSSQCMTYWDREINYLNEYKCKLINSFHGIVHIVVKLVITSQVFHAFYGTHRFMTMFHVHKAHHWTLLSHSDPFTTHICPMSFFHSLSYAKELIKSKALCDIL